MPGSFVSDLIKAAVIDLLFKRPIQLQFGRDATGKIDFRANINPSSGNSSNQPPVVVMQAPPMYGYPGAYPPGYAPPYQFAGQSPPAASGVQNQPEKRQEIDLQLPDFVRR